MSTSTDNLAPTAEAYDATDEDEVFLRQNKSYSHLSSFQQLGNLFPTNPITNKDVSFEDGRLSGRRNLTNLRSVTNSETSDLDLSCSFNDGVPIFESSSVLLPEAVESRTRMPGGGPSTSFVYGTREISNKVGDLMLQPSSSNNTSNIYSWQSSEAGCSGTRTSKKAKRRPYDFSDASKAEHKHWRQQIDTFSQYAEWVAKVNEIRSEDMPAIENAESITTCDPAEEYFFHATFPLIADDELAEINKFIDGVNKKIDEQENEVAETDANLQTQKKVWSQREVWDPFLSDKLSRTKRGMTENTMHKDVHLFICFACGRAFDDELQMRDHVNAVHLSDQGYEHKCPKCYRRFKLKHHVMRHLKTHDETAVFRCDRCSSSYRKKESLTIHQSRAHSIDENGKAIDTLDFVCKRCQKIFGTLIELNRHKYLCLKNERLSESRSENVGNKTKMPRNSSLHTFSSPSSPRPLLSTVCLVCHNKFASTQSLIRHIGRKHPNEQYVRKYELVSSAESPNLPFVCSECQKRFATPSALSLHKRRHLGDRPFQCEKCGRKYPIASELRKHVRRTHEKREGLNEMEGASVEDQTDLDQSGLSESMKEVDFVKKKKRISMDDDLTDFNF